MHTFEQEAEDGFANSPGFRAQMSRLSPFGQSYERRFFSPDSFCASPGLPERFRFQSPEPAHASSAPFLGFSQQLLSIYASSLFGFSVKLHQRIKELVELKPNWDGAAALTPRPEVVAHTVGLLFVLKASVRGFEEPFLVPTIGGFTQLEWHDKERDLEFEATDSGWAIVGTETDAHGSRTYHQADIGRLSTQNASKFIEAYRWFQGAERLWPIK